MIYLLFGDNYFEKQQKLSALVGESEVVRADGELLDQAGFWELVDGQSLFSDEQKVVIKDLSENPNLWTILPELKISDRSDLILLESKIDKRTKTYKWLQKNAKTSELVNFSEKQRPQLARWCQLQAEKYGFKLSQNQAEVLIQRLGYDQARLDNVLRQLSLAGEISESAIDDLVPLPKEQSVFDLFAAAIQKDSQKIQQIIAYLSLNGGSDEAYRTLGLLSSQLLLLNALVLGGDSSAVASDFAAHPFAVRKLLSLSKDVSASSLPEINSFFVEADMQMKTTTISPWLALEIALLRTARRQ